MLKAVIFDVDGTLVDSVDLHAAAWREALQHFGRDVSVDDVRAQIGKGADQLLPVFFDAEELRRVQQPIETFRADLFQRRYLPEVRAFPKARELLLRLMDDDLGVALASSCQERELATYKRVMGISDVTIIEVNGADAAHSKPYPDIFNTALARLGDPPPKHVVVVGDSPYDVQAARQAHLQTLGVLCGGFPEEELRLAGCVDIYHSPADLLEHYAEWVYRKRPYRREGLPIEPSPALEHQEELQTKRSA